MIHFVWNIPSVVDYEKDIFVCVIPLNELVEVLNNKNVIFSRFQYHVVVTNTLYIRLKLVLCQQLIKFVSVPFASRILKMLINVKNDNVLLFWMIPIFF
jgi:hypothetical protein